MLWGFFHSKLLVYQINPRKSHENPRKSPKNKQEIPEHLHLLMVPSGYQTQGERSLTLVADLALPASWPRAWVLKCCCKTVPWWRWGGWSWGAGKWWKFSGYHPDYFRIDLEYLEWRCTWDIYRVYIYKYNYIYMYIIVGNKKWSVSWAADSWISIPWDDWVSGGWGCEDTGFCCVHLYLVGGLEHVFSPIYWE